MPGTLAEHERRAGVVADLRASFFVGDAAGRAGDFASTDRKWARNVGVPFFTPEVWDASK
jgi:bifunctional polynucleotide phosphatase/kinase